MTNFDLLKIEIQKCMSPQEFEDVLEHFRYEVFDCNMTEKCIQGYSCKQCYRDWMNKKVK